MVNLETTTLWRKATPLVRLFLLLGALGILSNAATIVSVSSPLPGGSYPGLGVVAASSWSSSRTYTDVAIAAVLRGGVAQQGTAYLMTQVGPGTTSASEIARSSFLSPSADSPVTLFAGLTLPAGTYYLVLAGGGRWLDALHSRTVVLDDGVTRNNDLIAFGSQSAYAPASAFLANAGILGEPFFQYSVTTVPEPATVKIVGSCLLALTCIFGFRRRT